CKRLATLLSHLPSPPSPPKPLTPSPPLPLRTVNGSRHRCPAQTPSIATGDAEFHVALLSTRRCEPGFLQCVQFTPKVPAINWVRCRDLLLQSSLVLTEMDLLPGSTLPPDLRARLVFCVLWTACGCPPRIEGILVSILNRRICCPGIHKALQTAAECVAGGEILSDAWMLVIGQQSQVDVLL
ncbi:Protein of unknown function, partial [Gryllus bimaculatus]